VIFLSLNLKNMIFCSGCVEVEYASAFRVGFNRFPARHPSPPFPTNSLPRLINHRSSNSSLDPSRSFAAAGSIRFSCVGRDPRRSRIFYQRQATMSEVFEGYERQYCEISASLSRKCAAASALDGGTYARTPLSLSRPPQVSGCFCIPV
jgi:hypothetical protein